MISASWSRRTLGLLALLLAGVVVVTIWLRVDHAGGPAGSLALILGGSAAIGAIVATVQVLVKGHPGHP